MTFADTKKQLSQLLSDSDNKVISLSGKWGTGKTHLLKELTKTHPVAKDVITVSLFGLSSMEQLKKSLLQASTPLEKVDEGIGEGLKALAKAGWSAATEHFKPLAALNDVNLVMMVPALLKNKLVVIDDIERKHSDLGMDELLGFVDDYSKQRGTRFILVLNDDQLKNGHKEAWQTLNEKVVDRGLKLVTSSEEAFDIAVMNCPSPYSAALRKAIAVCELTNIRIIQQVIKIANSILEGRTMDEAVVARVVPSIVLFSAIHYRGLMDGPDKEFALEVGWKIDWKAHEREKKGELTEDDKRAKRWRSLMYELGIRQCEELEMVLVDFLESGLFDPTKINEIIDRYNGQNKALLLRERIQNFLFGSLWDHKKSEAQLLADAAEFVEVAYVLDPYTISQLCVALSDLDGGEEVAKRLKAAWIAVLAERIREGETFEERRLAGPLDSEIETAIKASENNTEPPSYDSLISAVLEIKTGGWGTKEIMALRNARTADFEYVIRTMDVSVLPKFMQQMTEMYNNKSVYDSFAGAADRFLEACKIIAVDAASLRLRKLMPIWFPKSVD